MNPLLHHYTTPVRAERILTEGLLPMSTLPGTDMKVSFAFPAPAQHAWRARRHDMNPGLHLLYRILNESRKEGHPGIVELGFRAPEGTLIYDRDRLSADPHDYLRSAALVSTYSGSHAMPEAALSGPVPPEALSTIGTLDTAAAMALFDSYDLFQRPTTF